MASRLELMFTLLSCWMCTTICQDLAENCDDLLPKCTVRMACGMALHNYRISCRPELYGRTTDCSEKCQQATISLATTSEGYDYLHCDCANNSFCHMLRNRTSSCWPSGLQEDNGTSSSSSVETSCRVAEWMCTADQVCAIAWDYYRQLCRSLFAGVECSRRCNNSVSILMRQRKARALHDCLCDGPDADVCFQERTNILRLCFGHKDDGNAALRHSLSTVLSTFAAVFAVLARVRH